MQVIPVIDLKDGHVVAAKQGNRSEYRPLHSPLCASSAVFKVMEAFLSVYDFTTFYIADLNAISGRGHHKDLIDTLKREFGWLHFWVDNGCSLSDVAQDTGSNTVPVVGTESQVAKPVKMQKEFILSLDFKANEPLGHPQFFEQSQFWPKRIIVMTLQQIGAQQGPDFAKLLHFSQRFPEKDFIAAGGVRHSEDLWQLKKWNIRYALVASAIHTQSITASEIKQLSAKKYP